IPQKSSFSKFDALEKRHLIHVRSSDTNKTQKCSNYSDEQQANCRFCSKPVYKMEEIVVQFKCDKEIYHKSCMRCKDCSKLLKFDNYQSHEGSLYCTVHFKQLFAPKIAQQMDEPKAGKTELIIRESYPEELPPDVARASDKPDLGLNELHQLNVRSRFQVFENVFERSDRNKKSEQRPPITRGNTILTKYRINNGSNMEQNEFGLLDQTDSTDKSDAEGDDDGEDADLVRSKKSTQKERPVGIGNAINDIRTRFEKGPMHSKEDRREERKQEIQNIRSRLFMGKQAKIKDMYQQAIAESEQMITSIGKKPDIEIGVTARSIKERFEKGDIFADEPNGDSQFQKTNTNSGRILEDAAVFESGITRESRNIFMELDANNVSNKNNEFKKNRSVPLNKSSGPNYCGQENFDIDVVKYDTKPEDIQITTAEITQKFKFFETYRPNDGEKRPFRITPPREGVVKMPLPESDDMNQKTSFHDNILQKTQTTSAMLNKFREMEQNKCNTSKPNGLKPLKCFTPPPDDFNRYSNRSISEDDDDDEDEEVGEKSDSDTDFTDEALKEAQNAARAKQLRAKFEKWQENEIRREFNDGYDGIYSQHVSDDSTIESTK
ncbi:hypothetical protein KR222_009340, partial [Zaprionus bogoriensis]